MFVIASHSGAELNANETKVFYTFMNTQCLKPQLRQFRKLNALLHIIK